MKLIVYHGGEPQGRYQLVHTINEAAVGIRNELGHMQWQNSMAQ
jgi:hypothetical protein